MPNLVYHVVHLCNVVKELNDSHAQLLKLTKNFMVEMSCAIFFITVSVQKFIFIMMLTIVTNSTMSWSVSSFM